MGVKYVHTNLVARDWPKAPATSCLAGVFRAYAAPLPMFTHP